MIKPNVLFITIDSLRANRIFGKQKTAFTPTIDRLISEGIYFKQTISSSDQTGTCVASIFTGLSPSTSEFTEVNFPTDSLTYFDIFKKNGYKRNAVVPDLEFFKNFVSTFDNTNIYTFENKDNVSGLESGLGNEILEFIEKTSKSKPWITYIHLMDLHKIEGEFKSPDGFNDKKYGQSQYDRIISCVDSWIAKFLEKINLENTFLVITSDHGEYIPVTGKGVTEIPKLQNAIRKGTKSIPFLDKIGMKAIVNLRFAAQTYRKEKLKRELSPFDMRSFNSRSTLDLYDELVIVPLIFNGISIDSHKIIPDMIRQIDIFPTILEKIGLRDDLNETDGRSVVKLLNNEKIDEIPAYIEVGINLGQLLNDKNPDVRSKVIGIRTSEFKYYRSREEPKKNVHLFNLKDDPKEENNLIENKELLEKMEQQLHKLLDSTSKRKSKNLSDEEVKKAKDLLMKLGYI